ncbi:Cystatin-B [Chionoecetes opilio]|uniref:Cystatin-B n=1 Tax=Chionoecetes opilio TaxID=41210 RepID=A0A8J5D413_CHIOP|nr:Cystatin-B [Chionoecetes opilio]
MTLRVFSIILIATALVGVWAGKAKVIPNIHVSKELPPNPEVQHILDSIKPQIEKELRHLFIEMSKLTLLAYREVLFGPKREDLDILTKADIGMKSVIHIDVEQPEPTKHEIPPPTLLHYQYPKNVTDPITFDRFL